MNIVGIINIDCNIYAVYIMVSLLLNKLLSIFHIILNFERNEKCILVFQ